MKGTLLNTATVAAGATIGLLVGKHIPVTYQDVALNGLGLVTCGLGVKMILKSHNALVAAVFLAAAFGAGVLVTAGLILIFQGAITLAAKPLRPLLHEGFLIDELTASGGAILFAIGIGLIGLKDLHTSNYLPALLLAPLL